MDHQIFGCLFELIIINETKFENLALKLLFQFDLKFL